MEPTGIFARTLAECLALQLAERNRLDPAVQAMLDRLDLLASGNLDALASHCGVDAEDLHDMVGEIRALDPKPGLSHGFEPLRVVVPDVYVRPANGGGWAIELNGAVLPRLIVDRTYFATVSDRLGNGEDRKFLTDCLQKASWLEKSLDQRARTILQVASEIVRQQDGFLVSGVSKLKPLNLRMVADAIGIHESTVSRATANKYMRTPRGIFEFKYFFSSAIQATAGGEAHSSEAVKDRIRTLIQNESPDTVLSDDAIVDLLGRDGIDIARRTVAKYREMMRIGSSVERRRGHRSAVPKRSRAAGLHSAVSV
jgi:RNA polymerase sigma-54 factor